MQQIFREFHFTWCWIFFVSGILLFSIALSYLIDTMISVLRTTREVSHKNKPAAAFLV